MSTYPSARIKLFNSFLRNKENMLVDDIEEYLSACPAGSGFGGSTGFQIQWQRQEFKKSVKLDLPEVRQVLIVPNYASVKDSNESATGYYFIDKIVQVSENCVRLEMTMDILNTLCYKGGPLYPTNFNPQTRVTRRHFDRFKYAANGDLSAMRRNVLPFSQGVFPGMDRQTVDTITDSRSQIGLTKEWYLIYASENGQTINTYLACSESLNLRHKIRQENTKITAGNYYYIMNSDQSSNKTVYLYDMITGAKSPFVLGSQYKFDGSDKTIYGFMTALEPDTPSGVHNVVYVYAGSSQAASQPFKVGGFSDYGFTATESGKTQFGLILGVDYYRFSPDIINTDITTWNRLVRYSAREDVITTTSVPAVDMSLYNKLDTTKRIIKCAYCPINIVYRQQAYDVSMLNVELVRSGVYKNLMLISSGELSGLICENIASIGLGNDMIVDISDKSKNMVRQEYTLESQLYHSDTFVTKLCLQDQSTEIKAEEIVLERTGSPNLQVDYIVSQNYGQTQAFKILPKGAISEFIFDSDETHKVIASVGDAFAETVYTSAYLDYLAQNYEYDRKSMKYQAISSIIGGAESVVADIASGDVYGTVKDIGTAAYSIYANKRSMDHKIQLLQRQGLNALNVSGMDVSAFVYGTNKLRKLRYFPKEHVRKYLANEYYIHGLSCDGTMGETSVYESEAVSGRLWWNYLQCDPVFALGTDAIIGDNDYLDDIKTIFREGVTIFHHTDNGWNLEQNKENWEVAIANRL